MLSMGRSRRVWLDRSGELSMLLLACTSGNDRWRMKTSCEPVVKTEVLISISR